MNLNIDTAFMLEVSPRVFQYVHVTLSLTFIASLIALCIGTTLALIATYRIRLLYPLSRVYISFFRGTPLLVQLFLLYYGIPQIIPQFSRMNAYTAAFIGLGLHSAAYMAESIRGAIQSIDKGQIEACLSVGMTPWQGMKRIVLPQAARVAIPSLGNSLVDLVKSSSLAFTLGVPEMLAQAKMSAAATYKFFESYLVVLMVYWLITICMSYFLGKLETRLNKAY
ncbi:amino acid ABC transporter membrane protein, PAAT family (TC 3.A.1.3.-) [Geosporobacter subterraneus DSM 17957]|uniref:Amino acid ABC transporter membrane protein, PAAT family (TC 3.A.1.3.-) n=1 Tax=Geosporobacter subterraneus DSM 17957 TaxID=1121919 RepID=A0A1M6GJ00_9FIRM|nr:amino acid ABC transporter permease [Geosporobacter subterraneus]SHJ09924.1 amino acid ABC transporter membrane protein, PAAT family (TC 3.A.1.3.-) [Geosporobacter subterraneus DSM 17957]